MNGIHIRQVFIAGVLVGCLYDEELIDIADINGSQKTLTICFFIIGIQIIWW